LYQHGGDRVDNEQLCVICHNPSAGEKNVRQVTYKITNADGSVNTDVTYDGKVNETYDMRYMLHAIHGIEKRGIPLVIYRGRGIFAFVTPDAVPPTGWPLVDGEPVPAFENAVVFGSTNVPPSRQTHNWVIVHYPKPPNECTACHVPGLYEAPDQTKAVALTVDPGTSFTDQSDDIVIGPTAGACTACHATAPVRSHATQFGYRTNVTKDAMLLLAQP
jgi:OmcA/MtrC family decaheme c-type cytochrome